MDSFVIKKQQLRSNLIWIHRFNEFNDFDGFDEFDGFICNLCFVGLLHNVAVVSPFMEQNWSILNQAAVSYTCVDYTFLTFL